ncbi:MAG: PEGA domain-containing protein [Burkholderia sp.]|jgi:hypothetical protein
MKCKLILIAPLAALLLAGCSTYVTVQSTPEGATVTDLTGQVIYGIAPVSIEYPEDDLKKNRVPGRCANVPGYRATWKSGATAQTADRVEICDLKGGLTVNLNRPKDAPGLETDLQYALERAQRRAAQAEFERRQMELYVDHGGFWGPPFWGFPW